MTCRETKGLIGALLDGELKASLRNGIEQHLSECVQCRRRRDFERAFDRTLSEHLVRRRAPRGVVVRLRRLLNGEAVAGRSFFSRFLLHPATGYAMAAVFLVALLVPLSVGRGPGITGWLGAASGAVELIGTVICIECDTAHRTPEEQRRCREFHHHTGVRTADGTTWGLTHRGAGAALRRTPLSPTRASRR